MATTNGSVHTGLFKYERIPNFCFLCGFIRHRYRGCDQFKEEEMEVKDIQYRSWIGEVDCIPSDVLCSVDFTKEQESNVPVDHMAIVTSFSTPKDLSRDVVEGSSPSDLESNIVSRDECANRSLT